MNINEWRWMNKDDWMNMNKWRWMDEWINQRIHKLCTESRSRKNLFTCKRKMIVWMNKNKWVDKEMCNWMKH